MEAGTDQLIGRVLQILRAIENANRFAPAKLQPDSSDPLQVLDQIIPVRIAEVQPEVRIVVVDNVAQGCNTRGIAVPRISESHPEPKIRLKRSMKHVSSRANS
jgi:hypothetical protein